MVVAAVEPAPPALVIAAPASGSGKTTIAVGLIAALTRRYIVAPFKVGPDYIDAGYHTVAAGRPGRNLDSVLCGHSRVGSLYAHGSRGCDISVIEGVMGLFDGRIPDGAGSTAEIAEILGAPVILVLDARRMSQSAGALVQGFSTYRPDVRIAGAIVNNVGSKRHADIITRAIEEVGVPVMGAVPRVRDAQVPSRHLGLITAGEHGFQAQRAITRMRDMVERYVDVERLVSCAACTYEGSVWSAEAEVAGVRAALPAPATALSPRVALAAGPAFSFSYAEHAELLIAAGARVVSFDPLRDQLPDCDGLVIPGGFPEEHLTELSVRADLREKVRRGVEHGMPVHAECAGLLCLVESLEGKPMLGILPGHAHMTRRARLGYRHAVACADSVLYRAGERVMGHEFHHTRLEGLAEEGHPAWAWSQWDGTRTADGFASGTIHASYLHVHPAGAPQATVRFVDECARYAARRRAVAEPPTQPHASPNSKHGRLSEVG